MENLIRNLTKEIILKEIGPGVGMDPLGATMPKGMDRADYNQLEDASASIQAILAVASVVDPTMLSDVVSAGLYSLEGDNETAADVIMYSAGGLGAGPLFAGLSRFWRSLGKNGKQVDEMIEAIQESISLKNQSPSSHPGHHPDIFKKVESVRQATHVINVKGKIRETSLVDEAYNMVKMKEMLPNHVPAVLGFGGKVGNRFLQLEKIADPKHFDIFTNIYLHKALNNSLDANDVKKLKEIKKQLLEIKNTFKSKNFSHGDLNPGNIVVDSNNNIWLIDPIGLRSNEKITKGMISDLKYFEEYIDSVEQLIQMAS